MRNIFWTIASGILMVPFLASASTVQNSIPNPLGSNNTLYKFLETIVNDVLLPVGAVVAAVMIIVSGFMYVTAQGNEEKIKKAHSALLWTVIGTAILLGAWVLAKGIESTINQLK